MEFRVLGPLEVVDHGRVLELGGPMQRAVLAVLLLEPNRVVSRDRLIDALWDESPPDTARKALQVHVSQLRKALGRDRVETVGPGYLLRVAEDELDVARFRRARQEGRLDEAMAMWRGPPLAGVGDHRFAEAEAGRLEELRLGCLQERAERELAAGRHAGLVAELEALVAEHPLREGLRAQLMLSLYRCGRQADALEAYRAGRALLVEDLGLEPGRALRDLEAAILRQDPALDLAPAPAAAETRRGSFVGRERELGALAAGLEDALGGRGGVFLLVGEPGIGKTRLAEELVDDARARGARVLVGRSWEAGGAPAFWPWVQALRVYVRDADPSALAEQLGAGAPHVAEMLPELRLRLPDLPRPAALEAESARFALFDATAEFLRRAAAAQPLVLFLDDLHAADEPSLLLLRFLARGLASAPLLVLAACRDVDPLPGHALAQLLAELAREPVVRRLDLPGLSEVAVADYVDRAAPGVTAEVARELHDETGGNPLFLGELVRLAAVEGRVSIPQSVRDVIARRLTHLARETNDVLARASVLGRDVDLDVLAALGDAEPETLLDTLDEAVAARVLADGPDGLRFAHVLIRDTLYETLGAARRRALHRRVVETLEAGDEAPLAELAHHALAGGDLVKGKRYAREAADRALTQYAYEEAARLYSLAVEAGDTADSPERCEMLLRLGDAELRAGSGAASKRAYLAAAEVARRLRRPRDLARAAVGYGGRYMWARPGGDRLLVPLLEEGLEAVGDTELGLRTRLLSRLAGALRDEPSRERRDRISREAVALARAGGDDAALVHALDGRIAAITAPDTVEECLAAGRELRALGARIGDREAATSDSLRTSQVIAGLIDEAQRDLDLDRRIVADLRQPAQQWQSVATRAMLALAAGRLAEAEDLIAAALAHGERVHAHVALPAAGMQRAILLDFRGRLDEALREAQILAAAYPTRPVFRCALAYALARAGHEADAHDVLTAMTGDALPFDQEWLLGASLLAEAASALGDADSAAALSDALSPWATLNAADHPEGIRGSVARYLAMLAVTLGREDEAIRRYDEALAMNERMGARAWVAITQGDLGELLGASDRGRALRASAARAYRELGMAPRGRFWQVSQA